MPLARARLNGKRVLYITYIYSIYECMHEREMADTNEREREKQRERDCMYVYDGKMFVIYTRI